MDEVRKMQRLVETSKFDHLQVEFNAKALAALEGGLAWRNLLDIRADSKFFVEKQTLDLNTTTQPTSRNNESLTLKKKDSELLGFQSRAVENGKSSLAGNFPTRKITQNVSDVNCEAGARKREFIKQMLNRQIRQNQNKSEVVGGVFKGRPGEGLRAKRVPPGQPPSKSNSDFSKKKRARFSESEIPNNTISSENESGAEEPPNEEEKPRPVAPWNGMVNSISDLRETNLPSNLSSHFASNSPNSKNSAERRRPLEGSESDLRTDKKGIFGEQQDIEDINLQTPEFGEFSYGHGFYSKKQQSNSSKILYKLYENPDQGYEVKELLHQNFVRKKLEKAQEDEQVAEYVTDGCEISGSEDAKEASCFNRHSEQAEFNKLH